MKKYYVYRGEVLVDVVQAFSPEGAVRQAAARTVYDESELTASSVVR